MAQPAGRRRGQRGGATDGRPGTGRAARHRERTSPGFPDRPGGNFHRTVRARRPQWKRTDGRDANQGVVMRKSVLFAHVVCLGWGLAGRADSTGNSTAEAALAEPVITAIRLEGTNVVVWAEVPAGITRVTLESCRRLGAEAWTPTAVRRLNGVGGEIT